jgi:hypothetical protein
MQGMDGWRLAAGSLIVASCAFVAIGGAVGWILGSVAMLAGIASLAKADEARR